MGTEALAPDAEDPQALLHERRASRRSASSYIPRESENRDALVDGWLRASVDHLVVDNGCFSWPSFVASWVPENFEGLLT